MSEENQVDETKKPHGGTEAKIRKTAEAIHEKFNDFAGIEKLEGFSFRRLMSEVFSHHDESEVEDSFCIGTSGTIPPIDKVDTGWPRPWMFFRALTFSLMLYAIFAVAWEIFKNSNLVPGLMLVGTVAVPISTLVFFLEINVRRNISIYRMMRLVMVGGVISLFLSLILFSMPMKSLGWMGASIAGLVEEPGKLLALLIVARSPKFKYKINGLVMGAAVGTGFAIFESLGYATNALVGQVMRNHEASNNILLALLTENKTPVDAMLEIVKLRGLLSPFGHIVWTAICGAAIWRVKGGRPFDFSMVLEGRFWHLFLIPVALHATWNANFTMPYYLKYILLGALAWIVVIALLQEGLKELRAAKAANSEQEPPPIPSQNAPAADVS